MLDKTIAPGVDLERDVLGPMNFRPLIRSLLPLLDARLFVNEPMGLRERLLSIPVRQRIRYHHQQEMLFVNLAGYTVSTPADVTEIERLVEAEGGALGHKGPGGGGLRQLHPVAGC